MAGAEVPLPRSLQEIEQLIGALYTSGHSAEKTRISAQLHQLQQSDQGWEIADALLRSSNESVRFHGALTYMVKINKSWAQLSEDQSRELLINLLNWATRFVINHEKPFVLKKLLATVVLFFTKPISAWTLCIRTLVCSLAAGSAVLEEQLEQFPSTSEILASFDPNRILCVLWFSETLVEEVGKLQSNEDVKVHDRVEANVADLESLLHHALRYHQSQALGANALGANGATSGTGHPASADDILQVQETAISCLEDWIGYAQAEWSGNKKPEALSRLRNLVEPALDCLLVDDLFDESVQDTMHMFRYVLGNYPSFFEPRHMRIMQSLLVNICLQLLPALEDLDTAAVTCAKLLLAYAEAVLPDLIQHPETKEAKETMELLLSLLDIPGYPGDEDDLTIASVVFWAAYVEAVTDQLYTDMEQVPTWLDYAKTYTLSAIQKLWAKIKLPPSTEAACWDEDIMKEFMGFRIDFRDLLQSAYFYVGPMMLMIFGNSVLESLKTCDWMAVEASLFCLNGLAEVFAEGESLDSQDQEANENYLRGIFGSTLFVDLAANAEIPTKVRRTAVDMLGSYSHFFMRHTHLLPNALNFLFGSLRSVSLASSSAKAIYSLCYSCRKSLTAMLDPFFQQYEQFLGWGTADVFTKEKVIGGIAAIVEALPSEEHQLVYLQRLLDFVQNDVHDALKCVESGRYEDGQAAACAALNCLTSIGKALQAPDEAVIDLASEDTPASTFWTEGHGASVQQGVIRCIDMLTHVFSQDADVIEQCCAVLQTGYKERVPGPFVLPVQATVDFVRRTRLDTPRLPHVLSTTCTFLAATSTRKDPALPTQLRLLLDHVVLFMQQLGSPKTDPEVSQGCIDILDRFVSLHLHIFLSEPVEVLSQILNFTIHCLRIDDTLPKRSACSFWETFVDLSSKAPPDVRPAIQQIITYFGPNLMRGLAYNACGNTFSSSIRNIAQPLRKLVTTQPRARMWLEQAVAAEAAPFASQPDMPSVVRTFTGGIMSARNDSATINKVLQEFWNRCRGPVLQTQVSVPPPPDVVLPPW